LSSCKRGGRCRRSSVETALWTVVARAKDLLESEAVDVVEPALLSEVAALEQALIDLDRAVGLGPGRGL
jgi:hypothetical protein